MEDYIATSVTEIIPKINTYGFAILENVIDSSECEQMLNGAWDFFEHLCPLLKRDDESTWKYLFDLYPSHGMLFQHWGIGHAQYIWDIRQNDKIINIFRQIWEQILNINLTNEDMRVSFDGASFSVPSEITKRGWYISDWFHCDQRLPQNDTNPSKLECIQSWITSQDVNEGDATLSVLKGSNNYHQILADKYGTNFKNDDWIKPSLIQINEIYQDCPRVDITCKAGSMVFWDSRTMHCGRGPLKSRILPNFRNVIYLCYMPKILIPDNVNKKRIKAFKECRTTNHWPNKSKLFPKTPRTYGKSLPDYLVNYKPHNFNVEKMYLI